MNKSEQKGYDWLLSKGYKPEDIVFQKTRTPDFLIRDGTSYEVKKTYGRTIWFFSSQVDLLTKKKNGFVLCFDDHQKNPIAIIDYENIKDDAILSNLHIRIVPNSDFSIQCTYTEPEMNELKRIKGDKTWHEFIMVAAKCYAAQQEGVN